MISVTRLNHSEVVLNSELIEHIEATPDTVITLTNNQRITVLETPQEIVNLVREYKRSLLSLGPAEISRQNQERAHGEV